MHVLSIYFSFFFLYNKNEKVGKVPIFFFRKNIQIEIQPYKIVYQQEQSILVLLSSEKIIQNTLSEIIDYLNLESVNNVLTMFYCLTCSTFNFQ